MKNSFTTETQRHGGQRMLTAKQAAERAGVRDKETIKDWVRAKGYKLPRLGRGRYTLLFPEELIDALIAERTPQVPRIKSAVASRQLAVR